MSKLSCCRFLVLVVAMVVVHGDVQAADPKFEFKTAEQKAEEAKAALLWKAQAKAGLILTSGNSRTISFSFGANADVRRYNNKFGLEGATTYARSSVLVVNDTNSNNFIESTELTRETQTSANTWMIKGRYDRFFTQNSSAYLSALASADHPAGKQFLGGGQIGYSLPLWKGQRGAVLAELGYDLAYESLAAPTNTAVAIHSLRAFLGGDMKIAEWMSFMASFEALFNLNNEDVPNASDPTQTSIGAFKDTRLLAKAGINSTIWRNISFSFGFTLKYDNNPALQPAIAGAPPFAAGFQPFADKLDTLTEAALVVNFQ